MASLVAKVVTKTTGQAAACAIYCAVAPELDGLGGLYFNECCRELPSEGLCPFVAGGYARYMVHRCFSKIVIKV